MDSLSPKQPQNNRMADLRSTIRRYLGVREAGSSHSEKLISGLGGFLAILVILLISTAFWHSRMRWPWSPPWAPPPFCCLRFRTVLYHNPGR